MTFNPKELDQLHFNREYRDTQNENLKGIATEFVDIQREREVMHKRLSSTLLKPTGGGNPEVVAARTSRNGTEYDTLHEHMDAMELNLDNNTNNVSDLLAYQAKIKKVINVDGAVDVNYWVSVLTGSDSNSGTISSAPFKTIQKALDLIPRDAESGTITIKIIDGTYSEDLVLRNKRGTHIFLVGNTDSPTNVRVKSIYAVNITGAYLNISGIEATSGSKHGFHYDRCDYANTTNCESLLANKISGMSGIYYSASKGVVAGCKVQLCENGIIANFNSQITVEANNTGGGNTYGITSARSIIHKYNNNTITGDTKNEYTYAGGLITNGGII
ncbi:hypothetical protein AKG34_13330 [Peribacillus butanolivorans]|uniref:hypothetical protein n=1 Tax=Peribacillus butanolivorans TaxID=421767 RepID=UPI0006A6B8DA|nr:hypothetical protein [Peribacillus butanolivorans]KON69632.1 hypothetical protein AKG34_13330 [Peribacillus butanolivorans]